jgi:DNA repair exonuclease SbcCD ATPase subunit
MKLSRLRIEALRQFRDPLEIDGLEEGINLFVGPNGAGKSTIVRAIRAAFFERYGSGSVTDLLPWGESGAGPCVDIDFESGGQRYRLRKRFLSRKRCSLEIDGLTLENAEAEARLAALLGFQYAGKGVSKAEHWGVPGLLWIQQGCGHEVHDAVGYATDHLRRALDESLGEVASTGGDEVVDRVSAEREKLLTRTGQPTGEFRDTAALLAAAGERVAVLVAQLAAYRDQVDRFGLLSAEIRVEKREQQWRRFEDEAKAVQSRLAEIGKLREALNADRQLLSQTTAQIRLLEQQQASFAEQAGKIEQRRQAAVKAAAALRTADQELLPRRQQLETARLLHDQSQVVLLAAERQEGRRRLLERIEDLRRQQARLDGALAQAREIVGRLNRHRQEIAAKQIAAVQLETLRRNERELQAARIRLESAATGLSYRLEPGQRIGSDNDDAELQGEGHLRLVRPTVLTIPRIGTLTIEPGGGQDLAKLAGARRDLEAAQATLLQSLGLDSLAAAEQRLQQRQAAEHEAHLEQALLDQLAPKGREALAAEQAAVAGELVDLQQRLGQLETASDPASEDVAGALLPEVEQARRNHADAVRELGKAQVAEQDGRAACAAARSESVHAEHEFNLLQVAIDDQDYQRREVQNQAELRDVRLRFGALGARVEQAERDIEAARPQVMQQDAERLFSSAREALAAHERKREEVIYLQTQLELAGAGGLEEQLAEARGHLERLQRRHAELQRRALALDLLAGMLRAKRQALTRRLQAPLLKHLNHYLQLLLPGASVTIDEALKPVALTLPPRGASPRAGGFEELSFGTREQISLISRLAYADLLKEAGRPTLVILDDCLVNTDATRMAQMKRILYDAATRHQILLFSCHPERWEDLGAVARDVLSLKSNLRPPASANRDFAPAATTEIDAS